MRRTRAYRYLIRHSSATGKKDGSVSPSVRTGHSEETKSQSSPSGECTPGPEKRALLTLDADNLLRSISIVALLIDKNLRLCNFTQAAAAFLELEAEDLGCPVSHFADKIGNEDISSHAIRAMANGVTLDNEIRYKENTLLRRVHPYLDHTGNVLGAFIAFIDVSEQARTLEELRKTREEAEKANEAKNDFLVKVSHEIRTPLNAMLSMLNMALEGPLASLPRDYIGTARDSGQHLLRIINDILDFSRIETGTLTIASAPFDLHETVLGSVKSLAPEARKHNLKLNFSITPNVPRYIFGDASRLSQVIINLVDNAIKFTKVGSIDCDLSLDASISPNSDAGLEFSVTDTGIGIHKEQLEHIFKRFYQVPDSSSATREGVGIGLSVCSQLAHLMEGAIKVQSEPGKGSRFAFTLPFQEATYQDFLESRAIPADESKQCAGQRLMVVDDNFVNRKVMSIFLEQRGHTVFQAEDGYDCLEIMSRETVDLIVMDLEMPTLDGSETSRMIRRNEARSGSAPVPIIAVTAHALEYHKEKALSAGMDAYVVKPVDLEALHNLIMNLVEEPSKSHEIETVPPPGDATPADLNQLRREHNDDEVLLQKIFQAFFSSTTSIFEDFDMAMQDGDTAAVARSAHKMASAASAVKGQRLMRACRSLEKGALAGENWDHVTSKLERLKTLFHELENHIKTTGLPPSKAMEEP